MRLLKIIEKSITISPILLSKDKFLLEESAKFNRPVSFSNVNFGNTSFCSIFNLETLEPLDIIFQEERLIAIKDNQFCFFKNINHNKILSFYDENGFFLSSKPTKFIPYNNKGNQFYFDQKDNSLIIFNPFNDQIIDKFSHEDYSNYTFFEDKALLIYKNSYKITFYCIESKEKLWTIDISDNISKMYQPDEEISFNINYNAQKECIYLYISDYNLFPIMYSLCLDSKTGNLLWEETPNYYTTYQIDNDTNEWYNIFVFYDEQREEMVAHYKSINSRTGEIIKLIEINNIIDKHNSDLFLIGEYNTYLYAFKRESPFLYKLDKSTAKIIEVFEHSFDLNGASGIFENKLFVTQSNTNYLLFFELD